MEKIKPIMKLVKDTALTFVFFTVSTILLLGALSGFFRISKYVYMRVTVPKCTAQTEATVLHYEDLPSPWEEGITIHNTRTCVEADLGNGLQEVELRGIQGKHEGDILILHYNPDNIKQFYTEVKQAVPDASDEGLTAGFWMMLLLSMIFISFVVTLTMQNENKEQEKEGEQT